MASISSLTLYPIKSCAGIALREATLTEAGLSSDQIYDREWMVVDAQGTFLSQRSHPRMALIKPKIRFETLELRAPGMIALDIPLGLPHPDDAKTIKVTVWKDTVEAYDCDETTATWFSKFLGTPCRLVRFHVDAKRIVDKNWTGEIESKTMFSDGFPILVASDASLADVNEKLVSAGREALPMNRFRTNITLADIGAFEEDFAVVMRLGGTVIKPVKPCARCTIPAVDQVTGERGADPLDIMRSYRANDKVGGGITFGMNAIVTAGAGAVIKLGQEVSVELAFE